MKIDTTIPVLFQKINTYETEDTRFLKVKIWLMHTGENLNGSYFDKSVVEAAIPSLANTPILAYIEDNSEGEKDFSDHRMVLVKEDGQFKIKYIGQAIGLIPETNNAQFEMRLCDDGVEREFLTVEGLVWQKWDDPIDIFNRDVIKAQSMELHSDYEGEWKDDKLFHFTKFKFFGACALGKDVLPAMKNATIETQFSYDKVFEEIQEKMEQFKKYNFESSSPKEDDNITSQEGGFQVDLQELLAKYSLTLEDLQAKDINHEHFSIEELESKIIEVFKSDETQTDFALTLNQLRDEIRAELRTKKVTDEWGYSYSQYWFVDADDAKVYAEDSSDNYRLVAFNYSVNGDKVAIDFDSKHRVKITYVPFEGDAEPTFEIASKERLEFEVEKKKAEVEKQFANQQHSELQTEFNALKEQFAVLESEAKELREFKQNKLAEERQTAEEELFTQFSTQLTEEEIKPIKENAAQFTLEEIETQLYALVGKKTAKFSVKPKTKETVKINIDLSDESQVNEKPYGHVIAKYTKTN